MKKKILEKEKEGNITGKHKFDNAISWAKDIIDNESKENAIIMLDYMMETIRNDLKYSFLTEIIYSPRFQTLNITRKTFIPEFYVDEKGNKVNVTNRLNKKINLRNDTIIVVPYRRERKRNAIVYLKNNIFKYMEDNHMGKYYELVDITYIYNGIHSISSGVELGKDNDITVKEVVNIVELFPNIHTDGIEWINSHSNKSIYEVIDFRIAILFELARLKYNIFI
ncbi:DUF6710 family protein [Clostridium sp.]|uniref:DUF6710 family protein n=1 Tax=Clostridium sp. TaxID=1506 RepID=UPI00292DEC4E|nr:DUF6710 family protein [Clostridium sp.]